MALKRKNIPIYLYIPMTAQRKPTRVREKSLPANISKKINLHAYIKSHHNKLCDIVQYSTVLSYRSSLTKHF